MEEASDTLNLSEMPNLSDTVGDSLNGPATMSASRAQQLIEQQAKMASIQQPIMGQVNRQVEKRPIAQFTGNYEQPPVGNAYAQQRPQQPMQRPVAQQPRQEQVPPQMPPQQMYQPQMQQPMYPPQMYQQPMYQPMYQQQMQQPMPQQMTNDFGAAFSEIIGTSSNEYECWIDLPGIDSDKLSVMVRENALHVSGERHLHSSLMGMKKGKKVVRAVETQSSVPGYLLNKFHFSFPFYKPVDEDNITAEYVNGQLHVVISILSSAKGVKVNVKF